MKNNMGGGMNMNRFTQRVGLVAKVALVGSSVTLLGAACWKGVGTGNGNIGVNENTNTVARNVNAEVNTNVSANTNVSTNSTGEVDTSDWLTYMNEEYGFSFRYPEDWAVTTNSATKNVILNPSGFKQTITGNTQLITVFVEDINYESYLDREPTEWKVISRENIIVKTVAATFEIGEAANLGGDPDSYIYSSFMIPLEEKTLVFFLADSNEDYQKILKTIVQTIE